MVAREFFRLHAGTESLCKELQRLPGDTHLAWQQESVSDHSPEPVHDAEVLCRQVVDPAHFDRVTGTIKPTFFSDASSRGASCHRLRHTSHEAIRRFTEARVATANINPPPSGPRLAIGYATVLANEVRAIRPESNASCIGAGVFDTAKIDDASHADVCQLVGGGQEGKSVRAQLFLLAKDRLVRFD